MKPFFPASASTPAFPVASTPACPQETLPSRRVSRTIHIYPTMQCNLTCIHCTTSSTPSQQQGLAIKPLIHLLEQATTLGYKNVSLSGGEPFLYKQLGRLVSASKTLGYSNAVITNGALLQSAGARRILRLLDLVTIGLDGKEKMHDGMRGHGAFSDMMKGLATVKGEVKKYGFIHTILPDSWLIFPWLAEFSWLHKAQLLHLHPLELSGRAASSFSGLKFTDMDLYRIYISHYYLRSYFEPELDIRLDLFHRDNVRNNPGLLLPDFVLPGLHLPDLHSPDSISRNASDLSPKNLPSPPDLSPKNFSSLFDELVINEHGDLLPLAHSFAPFFRIGNINSGLPLEEMIDRFMNERLPAIARLYGSTYQEIMNDHDVDIFNWHEKLSEKSHELFNPANTH